MVCDVCVVTYTIRIVLTVSKLCTCTCMDVALRTVQYSTLGVVIHDMVIRYGESHWSGTSPVPGKNRSRQDQT